MAVKQRNATTIEIVNTIQDLPGLKTHLRVILVKNVGDGSAALYYWTPTGWKRVAESQIVPKKTLRYDLTSQIDGNQTIFTLPSAAITDTLQVILGGLVMAPGESSDNKDFLILSNSQIQFHDAPPVGANLLTYFVQEA